MKMRSEAAPVMIYLDRMFGMTDLADAPSGQLGKLNSLFYQHLLFLSHKLQLRFILQKSPGFGRTSWHLGSVRCLGNAEGTFSIWRSEFTSRHQVLLRAGISHLNLSPEDLLQGRWNFMDSVRKPDIYIYNTFINVKNFHEQHDSSN